MAKDKSEKKDKKDKKDKKKEKHSDANGVSKPDGSSSKKSKKEHKKDKKIVVGHDAAEKLLQDISEKQDNVAIQPEPASTAAAGEKENGGAEDTKVDVEMADGREPVVQAKPQGALVPFANPLADERAAKKVFKGVKKGESHPTSYTRERRKPTALLPSPLSPCSPVAGAMQGC